MDSYRKFLKIYANFEGRAGRKEYWIFVLVTTAILLIMNYIDNQMGSTEFLMGTFALIFSLIIFIPNIAILVRRLHDINRSGWWSLLIFIPIIGVVFWLSFALMKSFPATNAYGPIPD